MSTSALRIRRWDSGRGAASRRSLCLAGVCWASAGLAGLPRLARAEVARAELARADAAPLPVGSATAAQQVAAAPAQRQTLSADQAVKRAAQNNATLRAALLDAAAARHAVDAERGARDPNLVASLQVEHSETFDRATDNGALVSADDPVALVDGSSRTMANRLSSKLGVTYTTNIGTQLEVGTAAGVSWDKTTSSGLSAVPSALGIGPSYSADAYLSARQPLLRGAGKDVQLAPLRQAQSSARAAEARGEQAASQTALDVLEAYWALWYADRAVEVQEQAASVARRLVSDAELRANTLGTGAEVDVLQFSTSAASIADALSRARAERTARAIDLGRLLGVAPGQASRLAAEGATPELGAAPVLDPSFADVTASPELAALRSEIQRAEARAAVVRDADQPRVDLFATASVGTLWDDRSGASWSGGRPAFGVLGGVEIALPLGSGRTPGDAAAAADELAAARARYQAQALALAAQASTLSVNLSAAAEQVELTRATAGMATRLAEAERQRLLLGTTTAQNVVTAEQTSREAELRRLQALVGQASARFELEHTTGTLLDRFATL
jgi:outer membrane protein